MKRFIALLLCVFMLSGIGCAEEPTYTFNSNSYAITEYAGAESELVVPAELEGCPVETIDIGVFYDQDTIVSLTLPETLVELGKTNIYHMDALTQVSLPETLIAMDSDNFNCCPGLTRVRIPSRVSYIGSDCFQGCPALKEVYFEGAVPAFGANCFTELPADMAIYVPDDQLHAYAEALPEGLDIRPSGVNAVLHDFTASEEEFIFETDTGTILEYLGYATRVDIPSTLYGIEVRAIGEDAFRDHHYVYYVTVPEGVTTIAASAFDSAWHLSHVDLPTTLQTIGSGAFRNFQGTGIDLPEGLKTIEAEAFRGALLEGELVLPDGLEDIADFTFAETMVESISFPASIRSIGEGAFSGWMCSYLYFEGMELPQIAADAFANQTIADVDINWQASKQQMLAAQDIFNGLGQPARVWRMQNPYVDYTWDTDGVYENGVWLSYDGSQTHVRPWDTYDDITVTALGDGAFRDNTIIEYFAVPYNDAFTTIGSEAFAGSSVRWVDLYDSVTTIGAGAFRNCALLEEITIPASVTSLAADAFEGCTGLRRITFLCDLSLITEGMLDSCSALVEVAGIPGADEAQQKALHNAVFGLPEFAITGISGDITVPDGTWAEARVDAMGEGVSYAWYVMRAWEGDYTLDESCTGNAYSILVDAESDCTEVYCVLTDAYGRSITSDSMLFSVEEEPMPEPVPVGPEGDAFLGSWALTVFDMGGVAIDAAEIGMVMEICFNSDGTADYYDGETTEAIVWTVSEGRAMLLDSELFIAEDGRLCMSDADAAMYFERIGGTPETPAADVSAPEAVAEAPADAPAAAGMDAYLNRKFTAESFTSAGQVMDAALLGAEYSVYFRGDGTMDFCLGGTLLENLPWNLQKVQVENGEADAFVINYYGSIFKAVLNGEGFDMDYYGTMMLHFVPAE